jgi:hypothetical protein
VPPKTESKITGAIIQMIRRRGHWARKVHGNAFQTAGIPDVDAVIFGRSVRIEVKRPGEVPTELQNRVLAELERAGAFVTVATSLDEGLEFVKDVESKIPH